MGLANECVELGRAAGVHNPQQQGRLPAWCLSVFEILSQKAKQLIAAASGNVVFVSYSCDATPVLVREALSTVSSQPASRVQRQGIQKHDFYLQRVGIKTVGVSGTSVAIVPFMPIPLTAGKKAGNLFSACLAAVRPYVEAVKPPTLLITHYCFDRAVMAPVSRRMMQWHGGGLDASSAHADSLRDLTLCSGCACHDVQNALKWSLSTYLSSGSLSLEIMSVLTGLRRHLVGLWSSLPSFLSKSLRFRHVQREPDCSYEFWCAMGIDASLLEEFAVIDPEWDQGFLYVNPNLEEDDAIYERVSQLLLHLFSFKPHTESRWLSLGPSSRTLLGSLQVGLLGLVKVYVEEYEGVLEQIPTILDTLQRPIVLQFLVISSLVCYPCEGLLQALMPDARLCLHMLALQGVFGEELAWLQSLSRQVWHRLAGTIDHSLGPWELRDEVLKCTLVSGGYLHQRLWQPLSVYPWKLAVGDLKKNLATLVNNPQPDEPFASKVWNLHRLGS